MEIVFGFDVVDSGLYKNHLNSTPLAGVFQTIEAQRAFSCDSHYTPAILTCFREGRIVGSLCWNERREYKGLPGAFTARSIVLGGPLVEDNDPEILSAILKAFVRKAGKTSVYSEFRNLFDLSWAWPEFSKLGFSKEPHMNYLIDLKQTEEQLMKNMSQSRRKMLRRVIRKDSLSFKEVSSREDIQIFFNLVELTYKKVRKPYPSMDHFLGAKDIMGDEAACFLCFKGDVPVASRFLFGFGRQLYDWYAGSDPSFNSENPNEYIVWEILKWAKARGYERFDFGGGGNPDKPYGPREFKRRFGGSEVQYDRYSLVHKPLLMNIGRIGFAIMQRMGSVRN